MTRDTLREEHMEPYRAGMGPEFRITTWDTGRIDRRGQAVIGYEFAQQNDPDHGWVVLFTGEDFTGSPLHADDSDETLRSLLSFLTLRPGDTDAEYFAEYTADQLAFCDEHAEALAYYAADRFGGAL